MKSPHTSSAPLFDRWNLVYLTMLFHGLATLIAWNMFITAKDYFVKFKLANTEYALNFLAYIGWASQVPNLIFNWFNVFSTFGGSLSLRIIWSVIVMLGIFLLTIVLAMLDSSRWPSVFFWLTMICVFFLNGFNAILQNSIFGIAARLPAKYMGAFMLGTNLCGVVVVILSFASTYFRNLRTSAIYYFLSGMIVLIICLDSYFALPLNKFYRYHNEVATGSSRIDLTQTRAVPYRLIFRQTKIQLFNIFITFFVTLALFPAVISDVQPVTAGFLGQHYVLITCFFTFSVMALIGTITASIWRFPNKNCLIVLASSRLLLIPLIMLCNYQVPGRTLPVLIKSDWVFWILAIINGWSSGHISTLGMMYVSKEVAPENSTMAGMIGAAILMTGLMTGVIFTRLAPVIVCMKIWT